MTNSLELQRDEVYISSLEELKRELEIQDTWDIEEFESPIKLTREELKSFREELWKENNETRKIERVRLFIQEKARINNETENNLNDLRNSSNKLINEEENQSNSNSWSNYWEEALAWVIWWESVDTLKKAEWWFNSIKSSLKVASKLFSEWKFVAWIWVLLSWILGRFSLSEWERKQKEKNESNEWSDWSSESWEEEKHNKPNIEELTPWNARYIASMRVLLWFMDKTPNTNNILSSRQISTKTFSELSSYTEDDVLDKLSITYNPENKEHISKDYIENISLLLSRGDFIDNVIGKQKPNWREELTIYEIVTEMHKYTKTYETLSNLSFDEFYWNFEIWTLNVSDITNPTSDLSEKFNSLRESRESPLNWVSKELILFILSSGPEAKFNDETVKITIENQAESDKDKKFLEVFNTFGENILNTIKKDFFVWDEQDRKEFENFFQERSLTPKEVFELFVITWGESNKENLNSLTSWMVFLKVWWMMWVSNEWVSLRWKTLDRWLITAITDSWSEAARMIPEPVVKLADKVLNTTIDLAKEKVKKITVELWSMLTKEQKVIFSVIWLAILFIYFRFWRLNIWASWAIAGITLTSVIIWKFVSTALLNWREVPKWSPLEWKSEEEITKKVIKEFEDVWVKVV